MGFFKKLGPHYAIERFGVVFLSLMLCMALLVTAIVTKKVEFDHRSLSGNAIYTRSFTMSQTGTTGSVRGVYSNEAHTKVFILLQMSDMTSIPTDANDYRLAIGGSTTSGAYAQLKSNPSGLLYVFGSTGYFGIYLEDVNGFPSQLMQFYLEALVNITGEQSGNNQYNRALIYCNPGGSYATHADFLERNDWQVFDMVEEIMTRSQERALRITLREDLFEMAKLQLLSEEYMKRLAEYDVIVPSVPVEINDTIYALANDKSVTEPLHYISSYGGGWVDSTGTKGFRNDAVTFYLDSEYVVPAGFDFKWQDGRILTGYLANLTGSTSLSRWAAYLSERAADPTQKTFNKSMDSIEWKFTDGTLVNRIDPNAEGNTQRDKTISDLINRLLQNWEDYYELKQKYEVNDLGALLRLESNGRNSVDSYTVNDGSNFTVYK